ncbi:hypothetical protein J4422_04555 [Candidatus Pacearchaeota archaeon]|nr:hypothetical protein [Candidatus Pacearchaeota archaeon]
MEQKIHYILKDLGLDDKEIRIYLFLVGNREQTAYFISKKTGIHRSTTYDVLERLIFKGFVNKIEKNDKIFYSVLEISEIVSRLKEKESMIVSLVPELEKINKELPLRVRLLESENGQRQFNYNLFSLIKNGKVNEIYSIGNGPPEDVTSQFFLESLLRTAKKTGIKYRGIWDIKFINHKLVRLFSKFGEDRFISNLPTKVTTVIFGDYVAFLFTMNSKPQVIEIQNRLMANEFKAYFSHLWSLSKKHLL